MGNEDELDNLLGEEAIIVIYMEICVNLRNLRIQSLFIDLIE
jgi:hypothetical protein